MDRRLTHTPGHPLLLPTLLSALLLLAPLTPHLCAQERNFITLTETQRRLLESGLDAYERSDYDRAIALFEKALTHGEANVLYLNLGRAYQRQGGCDRAREAGAMYRRALDAPMTDDPPPQLVFEAAHRYHRELQKGCRGAVVVRCLPASARLQVAGRPAFCGQPVSLLSGTYVAHASAWERSAEARVQIRPGEQTEITLQVETPFVDTITPAGWVGVGVGGGFVATGVVLSLLARSANDDVRRIADRDGRLSADERDDLDAASDDARRYETLQYVSYGLGAATIAASLLLLTDDHPSPLTLPSPAPPDGDDGPTVHLAPMLDPHGAAGIVLEGFFD